MTLSQQKYVKPLPKQETEAHQVYIDFGDSYTHCILQQLLCEKPLLSSKYCWQCISCLLPTVGEREKASASLECLFTFYGAIYSVLSNFVE